MNCYICGLPGATFLSEPGYAKCKRCHHRISEGWFACVETLNPPADMDLMELSSENVRRTGKVLFIAVDAAKHYLGMEAEMEYCWVSPEIARQLEEIAARTTVCGD